MLAKALREERDGLARQEGNLRWSWGDWAVKVAGAPGEDGVRDGSRERLAAAREDGLDGAGSDLTTCIPTAEALSQYRIAAAAIPPELRTVVRSIEAGRLLAQRVKDVRDRHRLIEALANDAGVVTANAVRAHFELVSTTGERPEPEQVRKSKAKATKTPEEKAAAKRIRDAKAKAATAAAEGQTLSAHVWRIIGKVDEWRRDLAVIRDELGTLREDERELVAAAYRSLRDEVEQGLTILEGAAPPVDDVIEGTVREGTLTLIA